MTDENRQKVNTEPEKGSTDIKDENKKSSKKTEDASLQFCTKAPSAEHHRADDEDEPCDDARGRS